MNDVTSAVDPWPMLRRHTAARIGLGRAGDSVPTARLLEFESAHARARDAVHAAVDFAAITARLGDLPTISVRSAAPDRAIYLQRPDLGRRMRPECTGLLEPGAYDIAFVIADGLSARAVQDHAAATLLAAIARMPGWRVAPGIIATQARVAIGDEIGERLGAGFVVVMLGERPGLSAAGQSRDLPDRATTSRPQGLRTQLHLEHPPTRRAGLRGRRRQAPAPP